MPEEPIAAAVISAALSALLVGLVRQSAVRHELLDHPNERSSHSVATPRGGGLGVVVAFGSVALAYSLATGNRSALVGLAGMFVVAAVGWVDDRRGLPVRPRLAVHLLAASVVGLTDGGATTAVAALWWMFWTLSSINVVNFMDGIDGLVSSQVLIFGVSLGMLLQQRGAVPILPLALAGATAGFLPWNFPRARIFLGDVGSGALGFAIAWLGAVAVRDRGIDLVRVYLPLVPLFGDAATTLLARWWDGEQLTTAHRRHLYQRLANGGWGHPAVTVLYAAAAGIGAVVARSLPPHSGMPWVAGFAAAVVATGVLLHRSIRRPRRG